MIGDPGGHSRTPLLPSAFLRPLSQRPMRMMKIVAHGANPTEGIMPIRSTRKAQRLAGFAPVAHPIRPMEALDGAGVGLGPAQVGHDLGQFTLTKDRSDFHLFDPPPLPMSAYFARSRYRSLQMSLFCSLLKFAKKKVLRIARRTSLGVRNKTRTWPVPKDSLALIHTVISPCCAAKATASVRLPAPSLRIRALT